ncbi:MAG: YebC/PmpR family DNA-binding transcriptional regulator [Myxococcota bacterium]
MSGHSKWSTIKRKKGEADSKKGKIFTKLVREITTAARMGGGDPSGNPRLRAAVAAARVERMPTDNIERAIKRGTGELEGPPVEEISYEGYAAAGVAVFIEAQTDNRNRTSAEVRSAFSKNGGNLGQSGSVGWMFNKCGQFVFDASKYTEDEVIEAALEGGAEDVVHDGPSITVTCDTRIFTDLLDHFEKLQFQYDSAELTMVPENSIKVAGDEAELVLRLVEKLEDLDDVQKVYANFDIDEAELERLVGS